MLWFKRRKPDIDVRLARRLEELKMGLWTGRPYVPNNRLEAPLRPMLADLREPDKKASA